MRDICLSRSRRKTYYRGFFAKWRIWAAAITAEWWSIEVFSGDKLPASGWRYAYEDELTEAAITDDGAYYEWHDTEYGVIFELLFPTDVSGSRSARCPPCGPRSTGCRPGQRAARLPRARRRGGGTKPRKPKPAPGAAALELEEPKRAAAHQGRAAPPYAAARPTDELRRELGAEPGADRQPTGGHVPGQQDPGEPVSRDIAAFDRSDD